MREKRHDGRLMGKRYVFNKTSLKGAVAAAVAIAKAVATAAE